MEENSIAGRTEKLRREIELIQHPEHRYRRHRGHSLAKNLERVKWEFRVLQIREELCKINATGGKWCVLLFGSAVASRVVRCVCSLRPILFDVFARRNQRLDNYRVRLEDHTNFSHRPFGLERI